MGKKSRSKSKIAAVNDLASKSHPIVEFRYSDPLFQMVFHPSKPIFYSGLATGYIYCHSYDSKKLQDVLDENKKKYAHVEDKKGPVKLWTAIDVLKEDGDDSAVKLLWKTKRHKGSVRCLCLDSEGQFIYSVGTDNLLKKAVAESGKVVAKISLVDQKSKFTKMAKSVSHPYLLLGDENGKVIILDSNTLSVKNKITKIHGGDAINDFFNFAKRSFHKYISLGQTTMAYWDCRESNESDFEIAADDENAKRKVLLSDDQEDEMLCGTFVDPEVGDTVVCGMGEGILTVWQPKKNDLQDQVNRIKVCKEESIDCIVPTLQDDNCVWCGCSNGKIYKVDVKRGHVIEVRKHSNTDEVALIDLDYEYRVASGGMDKVLIWELVKDGENNRNSSDIISDASPDDSSEEIETSSNDDSGTESSSNSDNDSDAELDDEMGTTAGEVQEESSADEEDESDRYERGNTDKKTGPSREELIAELDKDIFGENDEPKRKRSTVDDSKIDAEKKAKQKRQKVTPKQLKISQNDSHGIVKFDDL